MTIDTNATPEDEGAVLYKSTASDIPRKGAQVEPPYILFPFRPSSFAVMSALNFGSVTLRLRNFISTEW